MTVDDLLLEYWTVHYASQPPATFEADDPDFDIQQVLQEMETDDDDWEDAPHLSA